MEIWQSVVLGFVQGATEFLPVSSSGHLFLFELFLGLTPDIHFTILVHVATLLAVILVFWKEIWAMLLGVLKWPLKINPQKEEGLLAFKLIAATLGTVVVAFFIKPYFEDLMTLKVVTGTLFITGLLIWGADYFSRGNDKKFTWKLAILLGLVQGVAILPGISRSGLTIAFLIWWGVSRKKAVNISFLLSIPTILGALVFSVHDQKSLGESILTQFEIIGGLVAFFTALVAIYWMRRFVEKYWVWFAVYCFGLSAILSCLITFNLI